MYVEPSNLYLMWCAMLSADACLQAGFEARAAKNEWLAKAAEARVSADREAVAANKALEERRCVCVCVCVCLMVLLIVLLMMVLMGCVIDCALVCVFDCTTH